LLGYIGKCSAPCVGRVSAAEHRQIVDDFCDFMAGKTEVMVRRLEKQMAQASSELDFERAARLRDDLGALRRAVEKQAVVLADGTDADVVAFAQDDLEAAVQIFHVRGGRVRGQRGWVVDKVEDVSTADLVEQFLTQFYGAEEAVPREILVPELPDDADALCEWLSGLRGTRVRLRIPQRGDKRALMETVARNAQQAFAQHKLKRASDLTARSQALAELQAALGLAEAPLRIECFDVSHVQGTSVVASMVVFEDGLARKSEYRRFAIRAQQGGDVDWIAEAVRRRFARYLDEAVELGATETAAETAELPTPGIDPTTGRPRKFAYPPNLLVVDGGAPQVAAAQAALTELGIDDVAVVGLAKRLEEVWLPDQPYPVILPRTSEALYLLQRVRDEAHRFAISYHRQKRSRAMTRSALDSIPGLGESRRTALLRHFGSVRRLRQASVAEIEQVPGFGRRTAEVVAAALAAAPRPERPAVNLTTGEVLEDVTGPDDPVLAGPTATQDEGVR
jgi:excinuclease ABC subunit C